MPEGIEKKQETSLLDHPVLRSIIDDIEKATRHKKNLDEEREYRVRVNGDKIEAYMKVADPSVRSMSVTTCDDREGLEGARVDFWTVEDDEKRDLLETVKGLPINDQNGSTIGDLAKVIGGDEAGVETLEFSIRKEDNKSRLRHLTLQLCRPHPLDEIEVTIPYYGNPPPEAEVEEKEPIEVLFALMRSKLDKVLTYISELED